MGIDRHPDPSDDSVWPLQISSPLQIIETGNSPGTISAGGVQYTLCGGPQTFTVPNYGRPLVVCMFDSTCSAHVAGNAAGYFYLYVDGVERANQRWHTQGTEWHGPMSHPAFWLPLAPGVHTAELKASAEVAGPSFTYCKTLVSFFG